MTRRHMKAGIGDMAGFVVEEEIEQGGVKIDGVTISDKGLKLAAGSFVAQVGKRKFARVELS